MHIQPYFPEPLQVSRNAASERYIVTLSFIRAVMAGHFITALAVAGVAVVLQPVLALQTAGAIFLVCLLWLTVVRRLLKGGPADNAISLALMLPTVWSLGALCRIGLDAGLPLWIPAAAYLFASAYGALCGRDFSFVGLFVITAVALVTMLAVTGLSGLVGWGDALLWGVVALAYTGYFIFDLAALLSRRRLGEEPAAVADLYRDLLNFLTYSVRVALHWRRFRFV